MAAIKYTYSITGDFPNDKVTPACLKHEIDDSAIATALTGIHTEGDDCNVWFADILSGGDETLLDGLVAAHQGLDCSNATQTEASNDESTTESTDYQTKVTLNSDPLVAGTFLASWNLEAKLTDGGLGCAVRTQIECNSAERSEDNWDRQVWHHNNGSAVIDFEEGDTPVVKVNYKVLGAGGDTAHIRRARISLMRCS